MAKPINPPHARRIKVAVLMGGISREREVSIQSGKCVAEALKQAGVNVVAADAKPNALGILDDETIDVFSSRFTAHSAKTARYRKSSNQKASSIQAAARRPAGWHLTNGKVKKYLPPRELQCLIRFCSSRGKKPLPLRNGFANLGQDTW
jgi:D-alanine-D-alanine ligase-like ATP-grasp enzyme